MKVLLDFEDAVVTVAAMRENVKYIITRNTSDYKNASVPAINPVDFLKILS